MHCWYDTTDTLPPGQETLGYRPNPGPTFGGWRSSDEMCFVFLAYYPLENVQDDTCTKFTPCEDDRVVKPDGVDLGPIKTCAAKQHNSTQNPPVPTVPRWYAPAGPTATCEEAAAMPATACFTAEGGAVSVSWHCDGDGFIAFEFSMPASSATSWAAIGFSGDESMAGSDIVMASASRLSDMFATGHVMPTYDNEQGGTDDVGAGSAVSLKNGRLEATFRRKLTTKDIAQDLSLSVPVRLIYAYGGDVSNLADVHSSFTRHTKMGLSGSAIFLPDAGSCTAASKQKPAALPGVAALLKAHGVLQTLSFLALLFPGAFIARHRMAMKDTGAWFRYHIVMQLAGTAGSLVAVYLAYRHVGSIRLGAGVGYYHTVAGAATFFLVIFQVCLSQLANPAGAHCLVAITIRAH